MGYTKPTSELVPFATGAGTRVAATPARNSTGFQSAEAVPPLTNNELMGNTRDWALFMRNFVLKHDNLIFLGAPQAVAPGASSTISLVPGNLASAGDIIDTVITTSGTDTSTLQWGPWPLLGTLGDFTINVAAYTGTVEVDWLLLTGAATPRGVGSYTTVSSTGSLVISPTTSTDLDKWYYLRVRVRTTGAGSLTMRRGPTIAIS